MPLKQDVQRLAVRMNKMSRDEDFIKPKGPHKAPKDKRFIIFGRVDKKYFSGNAYQGLRNMKKDVDWHVVQPAIIMNTLPEGIGLIYRIKRELKT